MFPDNTPEMICFLCGVGLLTALATFWDFCYYKIPNKLTFPVFIAGLVYQGVFNQFNGLLDAGAGFLVGFGTLFVLWMVGGGGGGDAKLLGALSVWLGYKMTIYVLIMSTLLVIVLTVFAIVSAYLYYGAKATNNRFIATAKPLEKGQARPVETADQKAKRRVMTYAFPISLATWSVVFYHLLLLGR